MTWRVRVKALVELRLGIQFLQLKKECAPEVRKTLVTGTGAS